MKENPTPAEIFRAYASMKDSVQAINSAISGTPSSLGSDAERRAYVDRNVRHLEVMLTRPYWTDEDMTEVKAAISAGRLHLD